MTLAHGKAQAAARGFHVPFGLRDGRLFEPLQVARGKACGCTCPGCGADLIARHAPSGKVTPHFAHASGMGCATGPETALHLAAKQLIEERKQLYFPALTPSVTKEGFRGQPVTKSTDLRPGGLTLLTDVRLEVGMGDIRPDLIVCGPNGPVLVEIARTSFVTPEKLEKIKSHAIPAIEFDISGIERMDFPALAELLFQPSDVTYWAWHPDAEAEEERLLSLIEAEIKKDREEWDRKEALEIEYKRFVSKEEEIRRLAEKKLESARRFEQNEKTRRFAQLDDAQKLEKAMGAMGEAARLIKEILPIKSIGNSSIYSPPLVWQTSVFANFIHRAMKRSEPSIESGAIREWINERFEVAVNEKGLGIAVWYFLKGLEELGILARMQRQEFIVLVPDLPGALAVAKDVRTKESRRLAWQKSDEAWPSRRKSEVVSQSFAKAFGDLYGWSKIAGLLPQVRGLETPESAAARFGHGGGMTPERVRRFLLATGFAF